MIKDKTIFRNFIWNTMGSTLASFNSLFFLIAVTRINGIENAGIFSICVTTALLLYIFAIYSGRNCHVTDIENQIKDQDYIVSRIFSCMGMMAIAILYILFSGYDTSQSSILFFLCLWKALEAFADVFYGVLQKNGKLYLVGQSLALKSILGIIAFITIDYFTKNLAYACSMLPLVSLLVLLLFDFSKAKKEIRKEERARKENVFTIYKKEFFLFASAFLAMYLLNAPKYGIENYLTNEIQGIYGIILMPASILPLFAQFMVAPMMNQLTNHYKNKEYIKMHKIENKLMLSILGFGMIAILIAYMVGIPVLNFIYQVNLINYQWPLVSIILAYVIYAIAFVKTIILTIYRNIEDQFWIYLASCFLMFFLSNGLIQAYKEAGIIPTYLIVMVIFYSLFTILTRYRYKKKIKDECNGKRK